jgi:hypothetical protein
MLDLENLFNTGKFYWWENAIFYSRTMLYPVFFRLSEVKMEKNYWWYLVWKRDGKIAR